RAEWESGLRQLAEREQVMCKISGIVATATPATWKPADLKENIGPSLDMRDELEEDFEQE
ncbi:MAG: hypothetical protein RLO18_29895, partial [Gimesia chilikensis]